MFAGFRFFCFILDKVVIICNRFVIKPNQFVNSYLCLKG